MTERGRNRKPLRIPVGETTWTLNARMERTVPVRGLISHPAEGSARSQVADALEHPHDFEPLRRALTPDDRITIVVDDQLPQLAELLAGILAHLAEARVQLAAVTLLLAPPARNQQFIDDLPDEFADVRVVIHDPGDRQKLAYLAATKNGRRVYLNKTLVESDFVIVLTGRRYHPSLGIGGGATDLYPALSNEDVRRELDTLPPFVGNALPFAEDSTEVAWLLGTPFFVQVIEDGQQGIHRVIAGLANSLPHGESVLRERWQGTVPRQADLVIVTADGSMSSLAQAVANAARCVTAHGRIVLLTPPPTDADDALLMLRKAPDPGRATKTLMESKPPGLASSLLWSLACQTARIDVGPDWSDELAEGLFATPVADELAVQKLIDAAPHCLIVTDAHLADLRLQLT